MSKEASEAARARSCWAMGDMDVLWAGAMSWWWAAGCVMGVVLWAAAVVVSAWLGTGGGVVLRAFGVVLFIAAPPPALSWDELFCLVMRLPGAALPFSCRLSWAFAGFLFPFATIGGGADGVRTPRADSTAGQDEPDWKMVAAGGVGGVVCRVMDGGGRGRT